MLSCGLKSDACFFCDASSEKSSVIGCEDKQDKCTYKNVTIQLWVYVSGFSKVTD